MKKGIGRKLSLGLVGLATSCTSAQNIGVRDSRPQETGEYNGYFIPDEARGRMESISYNKLMDLNNGDIYIFGEYDRINSKINSPKSVGKVEVGSYFPERLRDDWRELNSPEGWSALREIKYSMFQNGETGVVIVIENSNQRITSVDKPAGVYDITRPQTLE